MDTGTRHDADARKHAAPFDPNEGVTLIEVENQSTFMKGFPPVPEKLVDGRSMEWILDSDKCRWAMLNMSKIVHTAPVSRGSRPIIYLPRDDKKLIDKNFKDGEGGDAALRSILQGNGIDGFIALKGGAIVAEAYCNGYRPEGRHEMMSITKSMVGATVGVLVGEGLLDVERSIGDYLPELAETGWADATLRQVLDMTTGAAWNEDHTIERSEIMQATAAVGLQHVRPDFLFTNGIDLLKSVGKSRIHGEKYEYCSGTSEVLGWLITRICGQHWQDVFADRIWSRLGAEHDALIVVDSTGQGAAHAGFNATLRDTARFGLMIARGGAYNGQQIVPKAWIDDIRYGNEAVRRAWQGSTEKDIFGPNAFYRSQFRVLDSNKGIMLAMGVKGQLIYINMSEDLVGVYQSTIEGVDDMSNRKKRDLQLSIMDQINDYC